MLANGINDRDKKMTYAGNLPLHLAMYSLRTVPAMNSSVSIRARSGERGMIKRPEVSLSSLLTAAYMSTRLKEGILTETTTVDVL